MTYPPVEPMIRRCADRRRGMGISLLEMLVTLVVVSMVVTILWQALFQLARVERILDVGSLQTQTVFLRAQWVRSLIESSQTTVDESADQLRGTSVRLSGFSTSVPSWPDTTAGAFVLEVIFNASDNETRLILISGKSGFGVEQQQIKLLSWPGRKGQFLYLDAQYQWRDRWPPDDLKAGQRYLPLAVQVVTGHPQVTSLVAAPITSGIPRLSRQQLERL